MTAVATDAGSSSSSFTVSQSGTVLTGGAGSQAVAYRYQLGYTPNGNVSASSDMYNGAWTYTHDTLNRLIGAQGTGIPVNGTTYADQCWAYDGFGNRTNELESNSACLAATGAAQGNLPAFVRRHPVSCN